MIIFPALGSTQKWMNSDGRPRISKKESNPWRMRIWKWNVCGGRRSACRLNWSRPNRWPARTVNTAGGSSVRTINGLPAQWEGLPAGKARNMCIHESQSLLFEKHLFLAKPFVDFFTRWIHEYLPDAVKFDSENIWSACTRVQPSLIRIEADEVTYPLHVILRFEIEKELINGAFGYFPSYTLGALNAAQFSAAIRRRHPDWQERLAAGGVGFIHHWLSEHVWQKGSLLDSREIMEAATGERTHPAYFLDHLQARYLAHQY